MIVESRPPEVQVQSREKRIKLGRIARGKIARELQKMDVARTGRPQEHEHQSVAQHRRSRRDPEAG